MKKLKDREVGEKAVLALIASCFGMFILLGDFIPNGGSALVVFFMVALMLNYLTTLELNEKKTQK